MKFRTDWQFFMDMLSEQANKSEAVMVPFGLFCIIASVAFYLINLYLLKSIFYDSLFIRTTIILLSFFLVIKNYWPNRFRKFLPLYWYINVLYSFPFFISFMTFKNHASAAWLLNLLGVVILTMLLVDWLSYTILLILGLSLAWIAFYLTTPGGFYFDIGTLNVNDIVTTFAVNIIMGVIFSHGKTMIEKEKITAIRSASENIAHELRTPLDTIRSAVNGIKNYLPILTDSYNIAKSYGALVEEIQPHRLTTLSRALDCAENEAKAANTLINILLTNAMSVEFDNFPADQCSIFSCVTEALQRFPFKPVNLVNKVNWQNKDDFLFQGSHLLTVHILFNLLKNSIHFIKEANKGEIYIRLEHGIKYNRLYFKDTALGIDSKILPNIFNKFYSRSNNGTGIGLSFCKMVMQKFNGDIVCDSKKGEYCEFILTFPIIAKTCYTV